MSDMTGSGDSDALAAAVLELDAHLAPRGWDQPERLYALVDTADLLSREPHLAESLGMDADASGGADRDDLTAVEQELPVGRGLEDVLTGIAWPETVTGCAAVLERVVLPPAAESGLDQDPEIAARQAASHPEKQDVRIVAGVTRAGATYCALRMRAYDDPPGTADDTSVVRGPDLVPTLLELLQTTLDTHEGE